MTKLIFCISLIMNLPSVCLTDADHMSASQNAEYQKMWNIFAKCEVHVNKCLALIPADVAEEDSEHVKAELEKCSHAAKAAIGADYGLCDLPEKFLMMKCHYDTCWKHAKTSQFVYDLDGCTCLTPGWASTEKPVFSVDPAADLSDRPTA